MNNIKKGDEVVILTGRDKGKRGVVLKMLRAKGKVVVENVNMAKRHTKGNPMQGKAGGIIEKEMSLDASNIAIWNRILNKPDRLGIRVLEDGRRVRFYKTNNEVVDI